MSSAISSAARGVSAAAAAAAIARSRSGSRSRSDTNRVSVDAPPAGSAGSVSPDSPDGDPSTKRSRSGTTAAHPAWESARAFLVWWSSATFGDGTSIAGVAVATSSAHVIAPALATTRSLAPYAASISSMNGTTDSLGNLHARPSTAHFTSGPRGIFSATAATLRSYPSAPVCHTTHRLSCVARSSGMARAAARLIAEAPRDPPRINRTTSFSSFFSPSRSWPLYPPPQAMLNQNRAFLLASARVMDRRDFRTGFPWILCVFARSNASAAARNATNTRSARGAKTRLAIPGCAFCS